MGLFKFFRNKSKRMDDNSYESSSSGKNDFVVIFAGTSMEAEIVRSMLMSSDITAFLKDENVGALAPWYTSPGGAGSVKVLVNNYDYKSAKLILEAYEGNKTK